MPEPVIIDTTIIKVKSTTKDTYGNLVVSLTVGEDIRISAKRVNLFDLFQEGRAVKLYWAEYMHKRYVTNAEAIEDTVTKPVEQTQTGATKPISEPSPKSQSMSKEEWAEREKMTRMSIHKQVALKGAIDWCVAGKIEKSYVGLIANLFNMFLNDQIDGLYLGKEINMVTKEVQPVRKTLVEEDKRIDKEEKTTK